MAQICNEQNNVVCVWIPIGDSTREYETIWRSLCAYSLEYETSPYDSLSPLPGFMLLTIKFIVWIDEQTLRSIQIVEKSVRIQIKKKLQYIGENFIEHKNFIGFELRALNWIDIKYWKPKENYV